MSAVVYKYTLDFIRCSFLPRRLVLLNIFVCCCFSCISGGMHTTKGFVARLSRDISIQQPVEELQVVRADFFLSFRPVIRIAARLRWRQQQKQFHTMLLQCLSPCSHSTHCILCVSRCDEPRAALAAAAAAAATLLQRAHSVQKD